MRTKKHPPLRTCTECGSAGRRLGHLCQGCQEGSPNALTNGDWVVDLRRRVMVWEKAS